MDIFVNSTFIVLILFTIWWFWIYKPKAKKAKAVTEGKADITVANGVYSPDTIRAAVGKPLTLRFTLKDDSHCAKTVIFSDFNVSKELSKAKPEEITITPEKTGEFQFACPMGMYRGKVIVEEAAAIDIVIDGGVYNPDVISAKVGEPLSLRFTRKDASHCAEMVIFSDFNLSEQIPIARPKTITFTPDKPGKFYFTCAMSMYKGTLIVES